MVSMCADVFDLIGFAERAGGTALPALGSIRFGVEQLSRSVVSSGKLIRAHADKERMTELTVRRELHAAHFNHLPDQSFGFGP